MCDSVSGYKSFHTYIQIGVCVGECRNSTCKIVVYVCEKIGPCLPLFTTDINTIL